MTDSMWARTLSLFERNQEIILNRDPSEPAPTAKFCRESAHRTLGHLTACQSAWLPMMRRIRDGASLGVIPINPDPLYTKLGYNRLQWRFLVERFLADREEWRRILEQVDLNREIQTSRRIYSAQTLTKRMVEHEKRHLEALL